MAPPGRGCGFDCANHFVFDLHHIRDDLGAPVGWDLAFLVLALVLIAVGTTLRGSPSARSD